MNKVHLHLEYFWNLGEKDMVSKNEWFEQQKLSSIYSRFTEKIKLYNMYNYIYLSSLLIKAMHGTLYLFICLLTVNV